MRDYNSKKPARPVAPNKGPGGGKRKRSGSKNTKKKSGTDLILKDTQILGQQLGLKERKKPPVKSRKPVKKTVSNTPKKKPENMKIFPIGGLNEIGKNMTVFEYGDDIIIVDCGSVFPKEDMLGVDLVIPDVSYLLSRKEKIRGFLFTHGHEDHIGGTDRKSVG